MNTGTNAALMAPSANRSRTRLGIRNATLNASIALPAPNMDASTWSRTSPRMRLAIVAAPADAAERASAYCGGGELGAKLAADRLAHCAAIRVLARQAWHHRLHHLAHVLRRTCPRLRDRRDHGSIDLLG